MRVIDDAWNRGDLPGGAVGTIGNYDGVHRGQQAILERVVARARESGRESAVITFDPHPLKILQPESAPPALTTPAQKRRLLAALQVDLLLVVRFTREVAETPAERFVSEFLAGRLALAEVFVGRRFAFGRGREGNLGLLERVGGGTGLAAVGVGELLEEGSPISSTRIRRAVAAGRVEEAERLLGRSFAVEGRVVRGNGRGREIGWPTANMEVENELLPADGVYATRIRTGGGEGVRPAVTNVGVRPTVGEGTQRVVETHLLDFEGDLYGREVEVAFERRLRDERRFPSLSALSRQIGRDVEDAREYFAEVSCWNDGVARGESSGTLSHARFEKAKEEVDD